MGQNSREGFLEEVRLHIGLEGWAGLEVGKARECVPGQKHCQREDWEEGLAVRCAPSGDGCRQCRCDLYPPLPWPQLPAPFLVSPEQVRRRPQSPLRRLPCLNWLGTAMTGTSSSAASAAPATVPCSSPGAHPQLREPPQAPRHPKRSGRSITAELMVFFKRKN